MRTSTVLLIAVLLISLCACGYKGPLYLPTPDGKPPPPPPSQPEDQKPAQAFPPTR